jgi:hypothetical protein
VEVVLTLHIQWLLTGTSGLKGTSQWPHRNEILYLLTLTSIKREAALDQ